MLLPASTAKRERATAAQGLLGRAARKILHWIGVDMRPSPPADRPQDGPPAPPAVPPVAADYGRSNEFTAARPDEARAYAHAPPGDEFEGPWDQRDDEWYPEERAARKPRIRVVHPSYADPVEWDASAAAAVLADISVTGRTERNGAFRVRIGRTRARTRDRHALSLDLILDADGSLWVERPEGMKVREWQYSAAARTRPDRYAWQWELPSPTRCVPPILKGGHSQMRAAPLRAVLAWWIYPGDCVPGDEAPGGTAAAQAAWEWAARPAAELWEAAWRRIVRRMDRRALAVAKRYSLGWAGYRLFGERPDLLDAAEQAPGAARWAISVPTGMPLRETIRAWGEQALERQLAYERMLAERPWVTRSMPSAHAAFAHPGFLAYARRMNWSTKQIPLPCRPSRPYYYWVDLGLEAARAAHQGLLDPNRIAALRDDREWMILNACLAEPRAHALIPAVLLDARAAARALDRAWPQQDRSGAERRTREGLRRVLDWYVSVLRDRGVDPFSSTFAERAAALPVRGFVRMVRESETWHRANPGAREAEWAPHDDELPAGDDWYDPGDLGDDGEHPVRNPDERFARVPPLTIHEGEGMRLRWLSTLSALRQESSRLGHCVGRGAYDDDAFEGRVFLYTLERGDGSPLLTVEVNGRGKVLQAEGERRRYASHAEKRWVKAALAAGWARPDSAS